MFTGIVEELGSLLSIQRSDGGGDGDDGVVRIRVEASTVLEGVRLGDSTAVNGCCLTVVAADADAGWWEADVTEETLTRTNLGALAPGDPVNLERPVRLADRLGGHLVQGHVDAVGEIVHAAPDLQVRLPDDLLRFVVEKGSITLDGISLTVVDVLPDGCTVAVIPHTASVTTLGPKGPGDLVNVEVDLVAKYVQRLMEGHLS